MDCTSCSDLGRLRASYLEEEDRLRRIDEQARQAGKRGRGRPQVVKPTVHHLLPALRWLAIHRALPQPDPADHPALRLAQGEVRRILDEARALSDGYFARCHRRLAVDILAALAGCSERTARGAVKEPPDPLGPPDLVWGPSAGDPFEYEEWIVGRPPTSKERIEAGKSRHDDGPLPAE